MQDRLHDLLFGDAAVCDHAGVGADAARLRPAVAVIIEQPAKRAQDFDQHLRFGLEIDLRAIFLDDLCDRRLLLTRHCGLLICVAAQPSRCRIHVTRIVFRPFSTGADACSMSGSLCPLESRLFQIRRRPLNSTTSQASMMEWFAGNRLATWTTNKGFGEGDR